MKALGALAEFFARKSEGAIGEVFSFIAAEKANYPISLMCRVLQVTRTSYHDWERRAPSERELYDVWLLDKIGAIHAGSGGTYGAPRIHAELRLEHLLQRNWTRHPTRA